MSADPSGTSPPELTREEWGPLKVVWTECLTLPTTEQNARIDRSALSPTARRVLRELLALDDTGGERLERPAHERLGLIFPTAAASWAMPSMVGRRFGPYLVRELVGRGGMGAVYEAERADLAYTQRVAIKTLWRGADSDVLLRRFRSERQILAALQHPNIAQLLDGGTTDEGTPWLAMEFVEGTPIDVWCDERTLDLPARLDLFRQVCAAVQHAHQRLVVHRDLKPSNILVTSDGVVKLLDFGVATLIAPTDDDGTLTNAGLSPFTAAYAAPEQLEDVPLSTATDIYALGAILTLLLAGEPPRSVTGLSAPERLLAVREQPPRLPSTIAASAPMVRVSARRFATARKLAAALRGELDAITQMAMRRDPGRRYASAEALSDDVRRYLRRDRVLARPDSTSYRLWSFMRRQRVLSAAAATVMVTITLAGGFAWVQARAATAEARRAERATAFLSGLVTGSNATSYDPLVRLSPTGTLAQLLDSALTRIPREFADDPRIRARLYTAIGANLMTQGRQDHALTVLDSARVLAASGYGTDSPEFARSMLEWANVRLLFEGPPSIAEALTVVERIASAHAIDLELRARLDLVRAAQAMLLGRIREADSLAAGVLATEARQRRTMLSLRAEGVRMHASSWIRRDPRDYLRRARTVRALADSLGLAGTQEQRTALNAEFEALAVLGRTDEAAQRLETIRQQVARMSDTSRSALLEVARLRLYLALLSRQAAEQHTQAMLALSLLDQGAASSQAGRMQVYNGVIDDALQRGDTTLAQQMARRSVRELESSGAPMIMGFTYLYLARAELAGGDAVASLRAIEAGQRWVARGPDLQSMYPLLRRVEIEALTRLGRTAAADSVRRTVAPRGTTARCTPGGDWKGCPD